jgi:hypothetical protein
MTNKLETARALRSDAEHLRLLAAGETNPEKVAEMRWMAAELDDHAANLERQLANEPPDPSAAP